MAWYLTLRMARLIPLLLVFASPVHTQTPSQNLVPEDRDISITGTIRLVHGFGPPGYGEDPRRDQHVSYWALETRIPITTPCTPEKTEFAGDCSAAKRMKLFFQGDEAVPFNKLPAAKWRNKEVVVLGKAHRADTAGEMTAIYMEVSEIKPASITTAQH